MEPLTGLERIYDEDYDLGETDEDIRGSDSEDEDDQNDDFEAQMQAELGKKVALRRKQQMACRSVNGNQVEDKTPYRSGKSNGNTKKTFGEDDDHDDDGNADPLYDPSLDEEDEQWVDAQRRRNLQAHLRGDRAACSSSSGPRSFGAADAPLPRSDAVLNCPACMTLLCRDCQRHEVYSHQYRAMFVENCRVDEETKLACPLKDREKRCHGNSKGKKRRKGATAAVATDFENDEDDLQDEHPMTKATVDTPLADLFNPVFCRMCNTQVAVMSIEDEVYHFYNCVTSHS